MSTQRGGEGEGLKGCATRTGKPAAALEALALTPAHGVSRASVRTVGVSVAARLARRLGRDPPIEVQIDDRLERRRGCRASQRPR